MPLHFRPFPLDSHGNNNLPPPPHMPREAASIFAVCVGLALWSDGIVAAEAQELIRAMPLSNAADAIVLEREPAEVPLLPPDGKALGSAVFPAANTWTWQVLPPGLIYRSYLAGPKEPRFAGHWANLSGDENEVWDVTLGGRIGVLRYGTRDPLWPEGWQVDIEGAAFPRLSLDHQRDLIATDFRFGVPLTYRRGPWETKFGYYHLSSHLGDEFLESHVDAERINYVRESLVWGVALRPTAALRFYGEAGWAFYRDGGAEPWELQVGVSYAPGYPTGLAGSPFFAVNGHLWEEVDFGGNVVVQGGWAWRGASGHLLRAGVHYLNGKSNQYQFFRRHEEQIGLGLWFDY